VLGGCLLRSLPDHVGAEADLLDVGPALACHGALDLLVHLVDMQALPCQQALADHPSELFSQLANMVTSAAVCPAAHGGGTTLFLAGVLTGHWTSLADVDGRVADRPGVVFGGPDVVVAAAQPGEANRPIALGADQVFGQRETHAATLGHLLVGQADLGAGGLEFFFVDGFLDHLAKGGVPVVSTAVDDGDHQMSFVGVFYPKN
jgi:hypothetical protein